MKRFICVTTTRGVIRSVQVDEIEYVASEDIGARTITRIYTTNSDMPIEVVDSVHNIIRSANATLHIS